MGVVKRQAVKALMASEVVVRAPPVIRDWLFAILARGDGSSRTAAMSGSRSAYKNTDEHVSASRPSK
jgi:hypothetical protein